MNSFSLPELDFRGAFDLFPLKCQRSLKPTQNKRPRTVQPFSPPDWRSVSFEQQLRVISEFRYEAFLSFVDFINQRVDFIRVAPQLPVGTPA